VTLTVTLSEAVNVTGTPTLALANGGTATYTGGTGTSTLTFSYTAAAGQTTADLATAASNALTGTIKDLAGNAITAAGFNNVNPTGTLAVDVTAPTVSTFTPADGATGVAVGANIIVTFSENIAKGSGTITLRSGSATGTIVESFDAATSNRLTLAGTTLTIDPTSDLSANTQYFVVFTSGNIKDSAGNAYAGISTYDFRTVNIINGTANNDTLTGTASADTINGLAGNDVITGGASTDSMNGGEGSDLYIIAAASEHTAAEIADNGASGTDEVRFTSATANETLTLYATDTGIEQAVNGTGTATAAVTTGTTVLNVNAAALSYGLTLIGNAGANTLTGGSGNDTLQGGAGNDTLVGGAGVDIADYTTATTAITLSLALTTAQNTGGAGSDTLSGIEGLSGGTAADRLTGNDSDNLLWGKAGNDTLIGAGGADQLRGGDGLDTLTGGAGADWFIFDTAANATTNKDTITDFTSGTDKLQFSKAIFTGLSGAALGSLTTDAFWSGAGITTAHDATDRFIYNSTTGALFYDDDGNAAGSAAVQVALLGSSTHPTLAYSDIQIIG
jgi:Ca2+-binding RTX toxin-like protein